MGPGKPCSDEGPDHTEDSHIDRIAGKRGTLVKIKTVTPNNRRGTFLIETAKQSFTFPYAKAAPQPAPSDRVVKVFVDAELGHEGFTYVLQSGCEGSIH